MPQAGDSKNINPAPTWYKKDPSVVYSAVDKELSKTLWSDGAAKGGWGILSNGGHTFTKQWKGAPKTLDNGANLSALCILHENILHGPRGIHKYRYTIDGGTLGLADGVGFVFDKLLRRNNIQKMRSVFLNRNGHLCQRILGEVYKFDMDLPKLEKHMQIDLALDLDHGILYVVIEDGYPKKNRYYAKFEYLKELVKLGISDQISHYKSGFFSAIITERVVVSLY